MARRHRRLRASVFRSTRATRSRSKAWLISSSLASALMPEPCADAPSQVKPISMARSSSRPGQCRGSQYAVQPTARSSARRTCANGTRPRAIRADCAAR